MDPHEPTPVDTRRKGPWVFWVALLSPGLLGVGFLIATYASARAVDAFHLLEPIWWGLVFCVVVFAAGGIPYAQHFRGPYDPTRRSLRMAWILFVGGGAGVLACMAIAEHVIWG